MKVKEHKVSIKDVIEKMVDEKRESRVIHQVEMPSDNIVWSGMMPNGVEKIEKRYYHSWDIDGDKVEIVVKLKNRVNLDLIKKIASENSCPIYYGNHWEIDEKAEYPIEYDIGKTLLSVDDEFHVLLCSVLGMASYVTVKSKKDPRYLLWKQQRMGVERKEGSEIYLPWHRFWRWEGAEKYKTLKILEHYLSTAPKLKPKRKRYKTMGIKEIISRVDKSRHFNVEWVGKLPNGITYVGKEGIHDDRTKIWFEESIKHKLLRKIAKENRFGISVEKTEVDEKGEHPTEYVIEKGNARADVEERHIKIYGVSKISDLISKYLELTTKGNK